MVLALSRDGWDGHHGHGRLTSWDRLLPVLPARSPTLRLRCERLAGERVPRPCDHGSPSSRRDLGILLAAATALLDADRNGTLDWQLNLPGDFTYHDLEDVARRYGR